MESEIRSVAVGSTGTLVYLMSKELEVLQATSAGGKIKASSNPRSVTGRRKESSARREPNNRRFHASPRSISQRSNDHNGTPPPKQLAAAAAATRESIVFHKQREPSTPTKSPDHAESSNNMESLAVLTTQGGGSITETAAILWKGSIYIPPKGKHQETTRDAANKLVSTSKKKDGRRSAAPIADQNTRKSMDRNDDLRPMLTAQLDHRKEHHLHHHHHMVSKLQLDARTQRSHRCVSNGRSVSYVDVVDLNCWSHESRVVSSKFYRRLTR